MCYPSLLYMPEGCSRACACACALMLTLVAFLTCCCLQISVYGMNERIGLVSFPPRQEAFDKPYSQETAHMIDQEVRLIAQASW